MDVEDPDSDADGECDEDHGEEEVLAQEGDSQWRRRDDLGQQEEEHRQGQQDGDAQSHLPNKKGQKVLIKFEMLGRMSIKKEDISNWVDENAIYMREDKTAAFAYLLLTFTGQEKSIYIRYKKRTSLAR